MKEFQKLIIPIINNKLLIRKKKNIIILQKINLFMILESLKNFSVIKNIIAIEIYTGQRPMIMASYVKKSLVINLRVTKNNFSESLNLLQKRPTNWKNNILLDDYYSKLPFLQANKMTMSYNKINKLNSWIRSAYLD